MWLVLIDVGVIFSFGHIYLQNLLDALFPLGFDSASYWWCEMTVIEKEYKIC